MANSLIVKDEIRIEAAPERVWEILTKPKYVAVWDELPEDYPDEDLTEGSQVVWDLPNGEKSVTTIIEAEKMKKFKIALYVSTWKNKPKEGDVAYLY